VSAIRFWVDGLETVDARDEGPLGDADKAELDRQEQASKWLKLMEQAACAAAALSAFIGLLSGGRALRHRCD